MHALSLNHLLVGEERLEYLTRGFRERPTQVDFSQVMLGVAVLIAFVVMLWILSRWVDYRKARGPSNSRLGLFFSLCRAHELKWSEWLLLWRVSRRHRLRDPARVFIEPERLDPAGLGRRFRSRKPQLEKLSNQLYSGLAQASSE